MSQNQPIEKAHASRFGLRDAAAFMVGYFRSALRRGPVLSMRAFSRVSALDRRHLPRQHFFAASDGARIACRTYGGPDSLHLVLTHGSGCFGDQLHALARYASESGLATVHTLDMRGHGHSSPAPDEFARYSNDLIEYVRALRAANPRRRIVLGGHSAGGGLTMQIARGPAAEGISGWLLIAPFLDIADRHMKPYLGGWVSMPHPVGLGLIILANLFGIRRFNGVPVLTFNREACIHDPRFARDWTITEIFGFGPGPIAAGRAGPETGPILLVAGDRDECFEAPYFARSLARIAPGGECRIFPGLGHWDVLVDAAVHETCGAWLRTHFNIATKDMGEAGEVKHAKTG